MNPFTILKRLYINIDRSAQLLAEIREGVANMTDVMDRRLAKIASELEARRSIDEGRGPSLSPEEEKLLSQSIVKPRVVFTGNGDSGLNAADIKGLEQLLAEIREGVANQTQLINQRMRELLAK